MKNILVPIDYSDASLNAFVYALKLNQSYNAKIYLLHVFDMPLLNNNEDEDPEISEYNIHKKQHEERLQNMVEAYRHKYRYEYEVCTTAGGHTIEIQDFTSSHSIDMIVIGNSGMRGIKRWLFGTVAIHLLTQAYIPVIAVPPRTAYSPIKKILLITDYTDFLSDVNLDFLKHFYSKMCAELEVALINNCTLGERYKKSFLNWIDIEFRKEPHFIDMNSDDEIIEAVNKLVKELNIDVITGVPHPHNWMETLFLGKSTDKIPVICEKPLMTLPLTRESFI